MPLSTFGGIEIGKSSLFAHQKAITTTGHNIANANNENYSRQRVNLGATDPLYPAAMVRASGVGMLGTGVDVDSIERLRDSFIDARLTDEKASLGEWEKLQSLTHQIELIYNEPSDNSLRASLDAFWSSLEDLANNPESQAVRMTVRERGVALADTLNHMYSQLQALGGSGGTGGGANAIDQEAATLVASLNGRAKEIAALNVQIKEAEGAGDNPNDLYDRRDALVRELTDVIDVTVTDNAGDDYRVNIGGFVLVQGGNAHQLEYAVDPLDQKQYLYYETGDKILPRSGQFAALFTIRDEILPYHFDALNDLAVTFTEEFNRLHRAGFGLDGSTGVDFFEPLPTESTGLYALRGDPQLMPPTGTYHMQADAPLDGESAPAGIMENYEAAPIGTGRLNLNGFFVAYDGAVDSLNDLVDRINAAGAGLTAAVDPTGRLVLTATQASDYRITSLADSGNLLDRLGILTGGAIYDGSAATEVNLVAGAERTRPPRADAAYAFRVGDDILEDLDAIAAAAGDDTDLDGIGNVSLGTGNSDNALALAALKGGKVLAGRTASFGDFYNGIIAKLGTDAATAQTNLDNQTALVENLQSLQAEVSGVSLDEEMTNLLKFQRGFEAASRFITIYDGMLDRIINGLKTS